MVAHRMPVEAVKVEVELAPPVASGEVALARLLTTRAHVFAHTWRRELVGGGAEHLEAMGQLDGLVESLVFELGRSLATPSDLPTAAWGRLSGVLRLSLTRGADRLGREFALLRTLLEQAAERSRAPIPERKRLRILLDAAQAQALLLLSHRVDGTVPAPAVAFGGVVVETA